MWAKLKHRARSHLRGQPGRRFQDHYKKSKNARTRGAFLRRVINVVLAVLSAAVGVIFVFIPGPAILFFFFSGALLASESLWVARAMDWAEVKLRVLIKWGVARWRRLSLAGEIAVVSVAVGGAAVSAYTFWHVLRD
jgi:hypothetical protein